METKEKGREVRPFQNAALFNRHLNSSTSIPRAQGICEPRNEAEIWDALQYVPADDREVWVAVGMAVKSELGNDGYSVWDAWSQTADSYNERDARDVWRSIKDGAIGIGTLFHYAKQHGWNVHNTDDRLPVIPKRTPPPEPKADTAIYAAQLWLAADFSNDAIRSHPYAIKKGIPWAAGAARGTATGKIIGTNADCVIVPIRNLTTDKVVGVQCINAEGAKQTFGHIKGNGLLLGNTLDKRLPWYVAEGWASAVSMVFHHQRGHGACAAAFGKSNLDTVARMLAQIHAPREIIILREVDK